MLNILLTIFLIAAFPIFSIWKIWTPLKSFKFMAGYWGFFSVAWSNYSVWSGAYNTVHFTKEEKRKIACLLENKNKCLTNMRNWGTELFRASDWQIHASFNHSWETRWAKTLWWLLGIISLWLSAYKIRNLKKGRVVRSLNEGRKMKVRIQAPPPFLLTVCCRCWMKHSSSELNIWALHKNKFYNYLPNMPDLITTI